MEGAMRALVAVASRHGATTAIAERIGDVIRSELYDRGVKADIDVRSVEAVTTLDGYGAVVLGSAVYMGRWLKAARTFANAHAAQLAEIPVWLFSSGSVGDPHKPDTDPSDVGPIMDLLHAKEHRRFAGRLDRRSARLSTVATIAPTLCCGWRYGVALGVLAGVMTSGIGRRGLRCGVGP
jgi:menaquinone-dependent protoporphyrinogen oxidase